MKKILQKIIDFLRKLLVREEETTNLGLATLGLQQPNFDYPKLLPLIQDLPELHIDIIYGLFGNDPVRLIDLARNHNLTSLKIGLEFLGYLRTPGRAPDYSFLSQNNIRTQDDYNRKVRSQDSGFRFNYERLAQEIVNNLIVPLREINSDIEIVIQPEVETSGPIDVSEIVLGWIKPTFDALGNIKYSYNPNNFVNRLPAGYDFLETHHDDNVADSNIPMIVSLDGVGWDIDPSYAPNWNAERLRSWLKTHENAYRIYLWLGNMNGLPSNTDPRNRPFNNTTGWKELIGIIRNGGL